MAPFSFHLEQEDLKKEKSKARELRNSQWWKRRCSKGVCYYCGRSVLPKELTMDHIVPISRGGRITKGNVVPACKDCNNKKTTASHGMGRIFEGNRRRIRLA